METLDQNIDFGPDLYNARLHIDVDVMVNNLYSPFIIDVETDEKDNFVGLALTSDGKDIYYFTGLTDGLEYVLTKRDLVGHNLKGDMKWLINWGVSLKSEQLYYDTCLASYVQNTTKESHGLKDLAREILKIDWPTYKQMVGAGKKRITLDKQPVERVAKYCGMDCLATFRLYEHFKTNLNEFQNQYLTEIELPTARALLDIELRGVQVDTTYLKALDATFGLKMKQMEDQIQKQWFKTQPVGFGIQPLNVNSNLQIAKLLQAQGAVLPKTQKGNLKVDKQTLEQWQHLPAVPLLLEYSKIEKLKSTYTEALLEKQKDGRIYASFNQISKGTQGQSVGISTGRLSSSGPNLQNIPTRTEEGGLLRKAFTSGLQKVFIDADFSQIEPRLVAHFTKDKTFVEAYKNNRDIYQELVEGTGRDRQDGKTFMLALLYGAQPKKLASVFKCSEKEAEQIVQTIMSKLPGVTAWINRVKYEARQRKGVRTLFGRWIPLSKINSGNRFERLHLERVAVNAVIQGSAAEIMKKSLVTLHKLGYSTVLTVHDEVLIELSNIDELAWHKERIRSVMESVIELDVPLKVDVGIGTNWSEAK